MTYARRKAQRIRNELLIEARCPLATPGKKNDPWPVLKARLDKAFSELVRMTAADSDGMVKCFTCEERGHWKDFDAGHFVTRDHLPTRWDMDNVKVQCQHQNRRMGGVPYLFGKALNELSPGLADRLIEKGAQPGHEIRNNAPQMLMDIRSELKALRRRFK